MSASRPEQEQETETERQRQAIVDSLASDAFADTAYDDITRLAAQLFETPIALITVIDGERQWFRSRVGTDETGTAREIAFCAHAILEPRQVLVVEDATLDPRFADNPLVTGEPHIRFYAGAPLVSETGHALGTLCVLDTEARRLDPERIETLRFLAQQIITRLEQRGRRRRR
jgi:GAF domain-containing protein